MEEDEKTLIQDAGLAGSKYLPPIDAFDYKAAMLAFIYAATNLAMKNSTVAGKQLQQGFSYLAKFTASTANQCPA